MRRGYDAFFSGRISDSVEFYRASVEAEPGLADAWLAFARVLTVNGRFADAVNAYAAFVGLDPHNVAGQREMCIVQGRIRDFPGMLRSVDRLEALGADVTFELDQVALALMHRCDWTHRIALERRLSALLARDTPRAVSLMGRYAMVDDPAAHLQAARLTAASISARLGASKQPIARDPCRHRDRDRLRIAYLSNDLNNNVIGFLIAGVLENHDKSRIATTIYDYSAEDGSSTRGRIVAAADSFVRIHSDNPAQSAARIGTDGIDILIDLKGYLYGARSDIVALRPAPIQVNFLGHVGTQASHWIDYVIADRHVLPLSEQRHWYERIVHMPNSYFPNDRTRPVPAPPRPAGRAQFGLPEKAIVFACFNSSHKITPDIFALWMQLLKNLPESVLWLVAREECVTVNLRAEASRAGVEPSRLVFATRVAYAAHIDRYAYADIFLDTPYNAHTTGADALWAGLPIITLCGRSFGARVGASLLHAVGLPELICHTMPDYAELALALARDPTRLAALRAHLAAARGTSPLFDAARFTADLERAYRLMADASRRGAKTTTISL